jgi:hypothetical protein
LKHDAPMYDKLVAAGVVRWWAVATPINHRPGFGWNLLAGKGLRVEIDAIAYVA